MTGTNPCAECQRNIEDCQWLSSRGTTPVPGWTAEISSIVNNKIKQKTVHILKCPLYISPKKNEKKAKDVPVHESEYTGFCVLCGASLTGGQRKYCTGCRKKYSRNI